MAIPMLGFARFALPRPDQNLDTRLSLAVGAMILAGVVGFTHLRLDCSLAPGTPQRPPHDQPVNHPAFASLARDMNLQLRAGFAAYHPYDFGLTAEEAEPGAPARIRTAISAVLKS